MLSLRRRGPSGTGQPSSTDANITDGVFLGYIFPKVRGVGVTALPGSAGGRQTQNGPPPPEGGGRRGAGGRVDAPPPAARRWADGARRPAARLVSRAVTAERAVCAMLADPEMVSRQAGGAGLAPTPPAPAAVRWTPAQPDVSN